MEKKSKYADIASDFGLQPQESILDVRKSNSKLYIGIPKETAFQEFRIPLTPSSVAVLVSQGHRVVIESKAGEGSRFSDGDYLEAGGEIEPDKKEVFKADVLIKIAPLIEKELKLIQPNQIIIASIHLPTVKKESLQKIMDKRATCIAIDYIREESGNYPFVRAMSEIAGHTSILIAAEYLNHITHGKGELLGGISGIPPATVVILGAGVVGEFAARTAIGLGAEVKLFDSNIYKLMRLQNHINQRVFTSVFNSSILARELSEATVAIGAVHSESGRSPTIVSEDMVENMKEGSVIVDVSIDQGGCFETSEVTFHNKPTFKKHGVIHYCVPNIASRVPRTASHAVSNILMNILSQAGELGGLGNLLMQNTGVRHGVYVYNGSVTNKYLSSVFNLKFTDLELLFAARSQ